MTEYFFSPILLLLVLLIFKRSISVSLLLFSDDQFDSSFPNPIMRSCKQKNKET